MSDKPQRPSPRISPDNAPFWEACARGELHLPCCDACGEPHLPPGPVCPHCLSPDLTWRMASGRGVVSSWTMLHQPGLPAFEDQIPYNIVQVETDEGPRLTATLVSDNGDPPRIGQRVQVEFIRLENGVALPVFRPVEA